ncbi:MAG: L-lactate dehydrogenase [Lachnospiraceae bacterium]|nr:L-lactate dehydrogenase [Lachnospiraceae bacterium]MDD3794704.1 L-lactate dehydrogenase [Lachnospiraceae bacterium]
MRNKITIIGAGSVGATIAYTLAQDTIANELLLIDINKNKAEGEVMDIMQSTAFRDPITVKTGDYEDAKGSNIVIITSGVARKPGQTRLDLTKINVGITKDIAKNIAKAAPDAMYIIVSNPVDILTYIFIKESGIPENQIIGSGTSLDTARLRSLLAEECSVSQKNVHAYIFGEHGDSSFVPWSKAHIAGVSVEEYYAKYSPNKDITFDSERIIDYVRTSGGVIIANKGATFYAIAISVVRLCKLILSAHSSASTVSTMMHGEYGLNDVCLSISSIIGPKGLQDRIVLDLTDEEVAKLKKSADSLKEIIAQI